jgi:hypothetical protein
MVMGPLAWPSQQQQLTRGPTCMAQLNGSEPEENGAGKIWTNQRENQIAPKFLKILVRLIENPYRFSFKGWISSRAVIPVQCIASMFWSKL